MSKEPILSKKIIKSKETYWLIVNRKNMDSEFGIHVNDISLVELCRTKIEVMKFLAKLPKSLLSWMVVSEFDVVNGKPQKYKIGVPGKDFLRKESFIFN